MLPEIGQSFWPIGNEISGGLAVPFNLPVACGMSQQLLQVVRLTAVEESAIYLWMDSVDIGVWACVILSVAGYVSSKIW